MRRSLIGTNSNYDSIYYHLLQKRKGIEKNRRLKELRGLKICVSRTRMIDSSSYFTKKKKQKEQKYLIAISKNPTQLSHEKEFQCISTITENVLQLQSPCPLSVHQSSKIAAITSFFQFPV